MQRVWRGVLSRSLSLPGFWCVLFILIFQISIVQGQVEVQWNSTIGGPEAESVLGIERGSDAFLIVGTAWSPISFTEIFFLLTIDRYGDLLYRDVYRNQSHGSCVIETKDGFMIVGSTFVGEDFDIFFLGTDPLGYRIWERTYNYAYSQGADCIAASLDDCFVIGGSNFSMGGDFGEIWLLKIDIDGSIIWKKGLSHIYPANVKDVVTCSDGGLLFVGGSSEFGRSNVYLLRIDDAGNVLWDKTIESPKTCWATCVTASEDDGFVIAGEIERKNSWYPDTLIIKINDVGEKMWERVFSGFGGAQDLLSLRDGFVVSGYSNVLGKYRSFLIKMDFDGDEVWNTPYVGEAGFIAEGFNQDFVVVGRVIFEDPESFADSDILVVSFLEEQQQIPEHPVVFLLTIISGSIIFGFGSCSPTWSPNARS